MEETSPIALFCLKASVRARLLFCFVIFSVPFVANAQNYNLELHTFKPAMDSRGLVGMDRAQSMETGQFNLGIYLNHAVAPATQSIDGRLTELVRHQSTGHALFAFGIAGWAEIGVTIPMLLVRGDFDGIGDETTVTADGLGDIRASVKITMLKPSSSPVSAALVVHTQFGTGAKDAFMSNQGVLINPNLVLDANFWGRLSTVLNVGYSKRPLHVLDTPVNAGGAVIQRTDSLASSDELNLDFGLALAAVRDRFHIILETHNDMPLSTANGEALGSTLVFGAKFFLLQHSFFTLGVGRALVSTPTRPDWSGLVGIVFEPQEDDQDGDGIGDETDQCVSEPEDKDGFEDTDGCPELDNDKDGLYDFVDACPNHAEDINNFEDKDGCPDGNRDRDRDGLVDRNDRCPEEPEDRDNYEDTDGCPDPDNDMDSIKDVVDKCPLIPEDIDGFQDRDGCPDNDNDQDGISDAQDRCPDQPENIDGIEDEDGCPEERVVVTREKIEFDGKVYFETDKAEVKSQSHELLEAIAMVMNKHPEVLKVEVQGHSDARGDAEYNRDLSDRRAAAVRTYLVSKGVAADRLVSKGYGESNPVIDGDNEAAWSQNRRVEFVILERAGMAIEGIR